MRLRPGLQTLLVSFLLRVSRAGAGKSSAGFERSLTLKTVFLVCVGAGVNACLLLEDEPVESFEVTFQAGGDQDHCMYQQGQDAVVNVSQGDLTCASIG